ncbi:MAG: hypothetical protein MH825_17145 [Cyanobacteria bacterium]|nr:hypothetical protein [Cyanobacteriota bacterium]
MDDRVMELADQALGGLYGWMPAIAAIAGLWLWRRYGQGGWAFLALLAGLRWGAGALRPDLALPPDSSLLTWFVLLSATYGSSAAIAQLKSLRPSVTDASPERDRHGPPPP